MRRALDLWLRLSKSLVPIFNRLSRCFAATKAKCQSRCECQDSHETHEERIHQSGRHTDLIDSNHDGECPHSNATDVGKNIWITEACLRRCSTNDTGHSVRSEAANDKHYHTR